MDLRGHGLSDAPTDGYDPDQLAEDAIAVAEGAGLLAFRRRSPGPTPRRGRPFVVAGHGFGAVVAAWAANALGGRCAGLVLVDGGWTDLPTETGMTPDEWLAAIAEPPEVLGSMAAWLADREAFDPATWDADGSGPPGPRSSRRRRAGSSRRSTATRWRRRSGRCGPSSHEPSCRRWWRRSWPSWPATTTRAGTWPALREMPPRARPRAAIPIARPWRSRAGPRPAALRARSRCRGDPRGRSPEARRRQRDAAGASG